MHTAVITGASKGIGRGIAIALAKKGINICVTGRSEEKLCELKAVAEGFGVKCNTYTCDHHDLDATERCFRAIAEEHEVDYIVNNAWGGYEKMVEDAVYTWEYKFWDQPIHRWTSMMDVGVRTAFLCSKYCVKDMLKKKHGAIVNISFWAARMYLQNVIYGVSKAAIDKMAYDMSVDLAPFGVPVISLYPGLVRTEAVMENAKFFDLTNSESPEFVGLVVHAFINDADAMKKSGGFYTTAELASSYGVVDIDGKTIRDNRLA